MSMPDFSPEYHPLCCSAIRWETQIKGKTKVYTVCWDNHSHINRDVQYDYSCTCIGYKMRGRCVHIEAAKKKHCNWNSFTDDGVIDYRTRRCPRCGGETTTMKIMV